VALARPHCLRIVRERKQHGYRTEAFLGNDGRIVLSPVKNRRLIEIIPPSHELTASENAGALIDRILDLPMDRYRANRLRARGPNSGRRVHGIADHDSPHCFDEAR